MPKKNIFFALFSLFMLIASPALSQTASASLPRLTEGPDKQSPKEIAEAARKIHETFKDAIEPRSLSEKEKVEILDRYQYLDPQHWVPSDLLETAVLYFDANKSKFPNKDYIGIVNYKPRSDNYRFYVINLKTGDVNRFRTAHGWGSDRDEDGVAERFSNVQNSGTSSIGFVRTGEVYYGSYRRSLRLDGLSSTNSKIRARAIVVHGWGEVHEAAVIQGLSWGCPALDWSVKDSVIDKIKEGSLMYMGVSNN